MSYLQRSTSTLYDYKTLERPCDTKDERRLPSLPKSGMQPDRASYRPSKQTTISKLRFAQRLRPRSDKCDAPPSAGAWTDGNLTYTTYIKHTHTKLQSTKYTPTKIADSIAPPEREAIFGVANAPRAKFSQDSLFIATINTMAESMVSISLMEAVQLVY